MAEPTPSLLTRRQVAEMLNVHLRTVDLWIRKGVLPYKKISRKCLRFRAADIAAFIAAE
jgi:excisionase family DNA binding protein